MSAALRAIAPGLHVTLQDAGRRGWRRFGVAISGAMDYPSLAAANALVGNPPGTPALEFAQIGGVWEVAASSCRIAVTGGDFAITADGARLAPWQSHTLVRGERLVVQAARDAVWGYLAVAGGFVLSPELGSAATHLRSGLGGGRIRDGFLLPLRAATAPDGPERRIDPALAAASPGPDAAIHVVLGPQDDYFTTAAIAAFLETDWQISHRGDRMGTWLDGPTLTHAQGFNVISDGLVPGCIQVPGAGQPVVLLMDCQTIGGFPKLATIVTADLARFAQCRPGSMVRFAAVDVAEAQRRYAGYHAAMAALPQWVQDAVPIAPRPFWLRAS